MADYPLLCLITRGILVIADMQQPGFDAQDQDRLRRQVANSIDDDDGRNHTVMALNADMLDADQNRVNVELLHVRSLDFSTWQG